MRRGGPSMRREWSPESRAKLSATLTRHGHRRPWSPTYTTWVSMRGRCDRPRHVSYKFYGGRGITVCDRWRAFANFLADMGERPDGMWLDRIDYNGNYEPGDCTWAAPAE